MFTPEELQFISELCIKHNVYALCDEVYEHLVFGGAKHVSMRSLPGMAERTLRLGSSGKSFSFTAWKVGWVTGPARVLGPIVKAHQYLVFTIPSNVRLTGPGCQRLGGCSPAHPPPFAAACAPPCSASRPCAPRRRAAAA